MTENNLLPLYMKIDDITKLIGVCRSKVYELIGDGKLIAKKSGASTLVQTRSAVDYMDSLPTAKIARSKKQPVAA
jgi:hypothetical protein